MRMLLGFKECQKFVKIRFRAIKISLFIGGSPGIVVISCDPRPGVRLASSFGRSYEGQHS